MSWIEPPSEAQLERLFHEEMANTPGGPWPARWPLSSEEADKADFCGLCPDAPATWRTGGQGWERCAELGHCGLSWPRLLDGVLFDADGNIHIDEPPGWAAPTTQAEIDAFHKWFA